MSHKPGIRNLPAALITRAPGGTSILLPIPDMRPSAMLTEVSVRGGAPVASMTVACSKIIVWAEAAETKAPKANRRESRLVQLFLFSFRLTVAILRLSKVLSRLLSLLMPLKSALTS